MPKDQPVVIIDQKPDFNLLYMESTGRVLEPPVVMVLSWRKSYMNIYSENQPKSLRIHLKDLSSWIIINRTA